MDDTPENQSRIKEIYMGDVQQNSRVCAFLHCAYIIEPISQSQTVPANTVTDTIARKFSISKGMHIHESTDQKITVSFPYHAEAARAMEFSAGEEILTINGCPYRFSMGSSIAYLRSITVGRRAHLSIKNLPLHMWTTAIVEQILSPYGALEYVDQETRALEDPSNFSCIVRCQRTIPIPEEIAIQVPESSTNPRSSGSQAAMSLFISRYAIFLERNQYLHSVTRRSRYIAAATETSASRIVSPAECYISPELFDVRIIQKYSSAVIIHPKPNTHFADLQHVCEFIKESIQIRVKVKMLNDNAFLVYFDEDHPFISLHTVLSTHFQRWITAGEMDLLRWTTEYGSTGSAVTTLAELKITGLPCNLCSVPIINYVLSPFALVRKHTTAIDNRKSDLGNSITAYTCMVWCASLTAIPTILRIKALPQQYTDTTHLSRKSKCKCPLLILKINSSAITDGVPFT
jgi:hypothetical protein